MLRRQGHNPCRKALARLWLVTDERVGNDVLIAAVGRMPRGSGVLFRHHATPAEARRRLYERVHVVARRRGLVLVLAGSARLARGWRADGFHARGGAGGAGLIRTAPAHDLGELRAAERAGADLVFLSPLFATRSHPGGRVLGTVRFAALARQARIRVVALGGMDKSRAARLFARNVHGWAAIDGLSG